MEVWIPYDAAVAHPKPAPTIASKSKASASVTNTKMLKGLNDQYEPENSNDHNAVFLHWWPKQNSTEWVQYDFDQEYTISESSVYWFDDGPFGGCRIPAGWKLLYKSGQDWLPVETTDKYDIHINQYDKIRFKPVKTTALKLEVQLPAEHSAGIQEWIVK